MELSPEKRSELVRAGTADLLAWAEESGIPLVAAHTLPTSTIVKNDPGLVVWLFFDTDVNVTRFDSDGTTARVEDAFTTILRGRGYPTEWLRHIAFFVDSHECVERDFEGSYFYYFR